MSTVVLSCSSLKEYVEDAMKTQNVNYDIILIDRSFHTEPAKMKDAIFKEFEKLPANTDTILIAMGFCGGVWDSVSYPFRIVIPRVDDCVSMLLHTDDKYLPNRKETGHLYIYEQNPSDFAAIDFLRNGSATESKYPGINSEMLFQMYFGQYHFLDIIDTGLNDCYSEEYALIAQEQADQFGAALDYVPGSNRILEKLLTGKWDDQFLVAEPGHIIRHADFF